MPGKLQKIARWLGYDLVPLPIHGDFGRDPVFDISRFLHNDRPIVFDVGANTGQSIKEFRSRIPECVIHSFEPSPTTFEALRRTAEGLKNVHVWNCGIGAEPGRMALLENSVSDMSSFLPLSTTGWGEVKKATEVEIRTVDGFCRDAGIEHIDVLKTDTQGFDLEVFKGAEEMIRTCKVGLVFCEIIFSDMYKNLPRFTELYGHLMDRDFRLVSFYGFSYQHKLASWTDALFVHASYLRT